jgi:hypothetical protein
LLLAGCGKAPPPPIVPTEGTVLLDGKPLRKATIRFIPSIEFGAEYVATGVTDDLGRFTLTCNGQAGACTGENRVLVVEGPIPPKLLHEDAQRELAQYFESLGGRPLPQQYGNLVSSPLTANVLSDQKPFTFRLVR